MLNPSSMFDQCESAKHRYLRYPRVKFPRFDIRSLCKKISWLQLLDLSFVHSQSMFANVSIYFHAHTDGRRSRLAIVHYQDTGKDVQTSQYFFTATLLYVH